MRVIARWLYIWLSVSASGIEESHGFHVIADITTIEDSINGEQIVFSRYNVHFRFGLVIPVEVFCTYLESLLTINGCSYTDGKP